MEQKLASILDRLFYEKEDNHSEITMEKFKEHLSGKPEWLIFHLCSDSDIFEFSIITGKTGVDTEKISHLLNETTALEVLPGTGNPESLDALHWCSSNAGILSDSQNSYFILYRNIEKTRDRRGIININKSRDFLFGRYLIPEFAIKDILFTADYRHFDLSPGPLSEEEYSFFKCQFALDKREILCYYAFKGANPSLQSIASAMMKQQLKSLGSILSGNLSIERAGPAAREAMNEHEGYSIEGGIYSSKGSIPYVFRFPRKLINLLPEKECSTVRGKILQTNLDLFRKDFSTFHLSHNRFLVNDLLTILDDRDLNLICQNFFSARALSGDELRKLIFYKHIKDDKTAIASIPFSSRERLLTKLPKRLRDDFTASRTYADSFKDLLERNRKMLKEIYNEMKEEKLLLSANASLLLHREIGEKIQRSTMIRLKKLVGDKRYLGVLSKMEPSKAQVFLSSLNHRVLSDLFVYQPDHLNIVKPHLSRNRFTELMEDVRFTREKIKKNQIDINRVCENIEKFNTELRDFAEREKEKPSP